MSLSLFLFSLQTGGAVAAAVGFQKGSRVGGRRSGEIPGDLQTVDLLVFHFVTAAGS